MTFKPDAAALAAVADKVVERVALTILTGTKDNLTSMGAVDTGNLRDSYAAVRVKPATWRVGTNIFYAPFVEFGTRYMAARPAFGQAVAAAKARFGR